MALRNDTTLVAELGWEELAEHSWIELVQKGLPCQLAELCRDLEQHTGRPLRVFTMPTMRVGLAGLALPFMDDDGIVLDGVLLGQPDALVNLVCHELAHVLYPGWSRLQLDQQGEMEAFALLLAPVLLSRLPRQLEDAEPLIAGVMASVQAA